MEEFIRLVIAGLLSGGIISTVLGFLVHRRTTSIEEEIRSQYAKSMAVFESARAWKEKSVTDWTRRSSLWAPKASRSQESRR